MRIFFANIPYDASEADFADFLARHGFEPESVQIMTDRETRKSKGYGFADLPTRDAERAIERLNGVQFAGRTLHVAPATPRNSPAPLKRYAERQR